MADADHDRWFEPLLGRFHLSRLNDVLFEYDSGKSGARVVAADFEPTAEGGLSGSYVVKFGTEEWAIMEQAVYKELQRSSLAPFIAQAQEPTALFDGRAAVAYEVAFGRLAGTCTLASLLRDGAARARIGKRSIKQLAKAIADWNISEVTRNRRAYTPYQMLAHMLGEERLNNAKSRLQQFLPEWDQSAAHIRIIGLSYLLPNPMIYLSEHTWRNLTKRWPYPQGRTHGDPHTGNIVCLPSSKAVPKLIDFGQFSSVGNPFFDLAYLEFDVIRHVLPVERLDTRDQWLSLLEFCMQATLPKGLPQRGYLAERAWDLIRTIRVQANRLQRVDAGNHEQAFEIAWWVAVVAVGLNFARKNYVAGPDEPHFRMSALMYAAFGIDRLLQCLEERPNDGMIFSFPWLPGSPRIPLHGDETQAPTRPTIDSAAHGQVATGVPSSSNEASWVGMSLPQAQTPTAQASAERFAAVYGDLMAKAMTIPCKVLIWSPSDDKRTEITPLREAILQALEERAFSLLESNSAMSASSMLKTPRWLELVRRAIVANVVIVPIGDTKDEILQGCTFLGQIPLDKTFSFVPQRIRRTAPTIVKALEEDHGGVCWYDAEDIQLRQLADAAIQFAEWNRVLIALKRRGLS